MATVEARLTISAFAAWTSALSLGVLSDPLDKTYAAILANGTSAGQIDRLYKGTRTLTASSTEDLDLAGTGLLDATGTAVTFARVKAILIAAAAANTNNVVVGAASSNAWATLLNSTGTLTLRPGSVQVAVAGVADATGWAVTAGTGDLLKVANSAGGTSVAYDLIVLGCSA